MARGMALQHMTQSEVLQLESGARLPVRLRRFINKLPYEPGLLGQMPVALQNLCVVANGAYVPMTKAILRLIAFEV